MLQQANIPHRQVDEITGLPEMLDGRVKTLHPKVHGGILGRRDEHASEVAQHGIEWIDLVVVNFYPFEQAVVSQGGNGNGNGNGNDMPWQDVVEYIDIGGPTMVRAAAKNFAWVGVVTDPNDYPQIIAELTNSNGLEFTTRKNLAEKAFALTSQYDAMIHRYFIERRLTADSVGSVGFADYSADSAGSAGSDRSELARREPGRIHRTLILMNAPQSLIYN